MFLRAIEERPSVRIVNAVKASLSKYTQVRAILSKEIQSVLTQQSGGSVESKKKKKVFILFHLFAQKLKSIVAT